MTSYPPPPEEPGNPQTPPPPPSYPTYPQSSAPQGMPTFPGGADAPRPPVERPQSINRAVMLMRAGAALSVINIIIGLATLSTIKDNIRQQLVDNGDFTQSKLDTAYTGAIVAIVVVGVIAVGLWLWMAQANGAGRKWARIVASVLGGLSIVGFLITISQGQQTAIGVALSAVTAVLAIAILVLLWSKESTAYYQAASAPQSY